jgi:hypothetical protein
MGRASAIAQVIMSLLAPALALAFVVLLPMASSAPTAWGVFGMVLAVVGFGAFAYARVSVLRTRGLWAWGAAGMSPVPRRLYWLGYTLMGAAVLIVIAAALASGMPH